MFRSLTLVLAAWIGQPLWAGADSRSRLGMAEVSLVGTPSALFDRVEHRLTDQLSTAFARIRPQEVRNPSVSFRPRIGTSPAWYSISGDVMVAVFPVAAVLSGTVDALTRSENCGAGSYAPGAQLIMRFENSTDWIQDEYSGVEGTLCTYPSRTGDGLRATLEGFATTGRDPGGIRAKKLRSILSKQLLPILEAVTSP